MKGLIKKYRLVLVSGFFFFSNVSAFTQEQFRKEITVFKKEDSLQKPSKNIILFIGSSSFTNWKDVKNYFPGCPILNRGFGGSTLIDVIYYAKDVILPYKPKQIVIYCGENDLASSDTVTPGKVAERFINLFQLIRTKWKKMPVVFVSIKPSPSRQRLMPKMDSANQLIKQYLNTKRKAAFVDVYHSMLHEDGTPMKHIFLSDNLHMNKEGYAIWQKAMKPAILCK